MAPLEYCGFGKDVEDSRMSTATYHLRHGLWLAASILLIDTASKYAVHNYVPYGSLIELASFFNLTHTWNTGSAFGFLADAGGWQRYFLLGVTLVAICWLIAALREANSSSQVVAYALILGGALGNGIDRLIRGYVVDYLDFHVNGWHWPTFNFADVAIVVGAMLMIAESATKARPYKQVDI